MKTASVMTAMFMLAALFTTEPLMAQARRGGGGAGSSSKSSSAVKSSSTPRSNSSVSRSSSPASGKSSVSKSSSATRKASGNNSSTVRKSSGYNSNRSGNSGNVSTSSRNNSSTVRKSSGYNNRSGNSGNVSASSRSSNRTIVNNNTVINNNTVVNNRRSGGEVRRVGNRDVTPVQVQRYGRGERARVRPAERRYVEHARINRFYTSRRHYYGYRIEVLPVRYERVVYWGRPYYCADGIYYRSIGGVYYVSRPPFGVVFDAAVSTLNLIACNIAYYNTVHRYYDIVDENYKIIQEQNRIIAQNNATIAAQNAALTSETNVVRSSISQALAVRMGLVQSFAQSGVEYYYDDGTFFILNSQGKYETIVPPAGATVESLPDDYEEYNFEGKTYYRVDDTIYELTVIDSKPVFEVVGQIPSVN